MDLIRITDEKMPIASKTAQNWHSQKKYPGLILLIGGRLFFDLDEWKRMAERIKQQQLQKAKEKF